MREIALHVMDIVQNSVRAGAGEITISLDVDKEKNTLCVEIGDNGPGMSEEMVENVVNPFVTSRTTRRVGLGLSLLQAGATGTGGTFDVRSALGEGTVVRAVYVLDHLDRPPIGDFGGTVHSIIICNPERDFVITIRLPDGAGGVLDTKEIRRVLGSDVRLDEPDISAWIRENIDEMFPAQFEAL